MTPLDAAMLACVGRRDRRWLAAAARHLLGRSTEEDLAAGAARRPDEPLDEWVVRVQPARDRRPASALRDEAGRQLADAAARRIEAVPLGHPDYPPALAVISDPPVLVWMRGRAAACRAHGVALVGCRAATPAGLAIARRLAGDLAAAGLVVVSGLARGIDASAHRGALDAGGSSVAVLGAGVDRIYPPEHAELADALTGQGALISEFPPGAPPRAHHFPLRNRLVSGLVHAVVVVEAPAKSGALITAGCALEQGRDVYVVPGTVVGGRNQGGHRLIRDGATLVETADDIVEDIGWARSPANGPAAVAGPDPVLGSLPPSVEFTMDELTASTRLPREQVLTRLLELEMAGLIQRIGSGRFVRASGRVLT